MNDRVEAWVVHLDTPELWQEEWRLIGDEPVDTPTAGGAAGLFPLQVRFDWKDRAETDRHLLEVFLQGGCQVSTGRYHWIVMAAKEQLLQVADRLLERSDPAGMAEVGTALRSAVQRLERPRKPLTVGNRFWSWDRTLVMGILNVTPDSFSDGGRFNDVDRALAHAREMVAQGADIIDIGAESTRPGHVPVGAEEELQRLLPVVRAVARELDVPISVDTSKAEVAKAAIRQGAHLVNDIWGLKRDPGMASVVADFGVPVIVMHNRQEPAERDPMGTLLRELSESVELARRAGVREEQIILDPGIGFGKTYAQNLIIMRRLRDVRALGYPVLLGTSRKSMIGRALNLPVDRRVEGTAATVALGVTLGMDIVRVHDVQEMVRIVRMTEAMIGRGA